jgi:hypothetical protein
MVMGGNFVLGSSPVLSQALRPIHPSIEEKRQKASKLTTGPAGAVGDAVPIAERYGIPVVRSPTNQEIQTMATKQGKKDNRLSDKEAMHIAETTDVSPGQAKELAEKHGKENAEKEAKNFKAEG